MEVIPKDLNTLILSASAKRPERLSTVLNPQEALQIIEATLPAKKERCLVAPTYEIYRQDLQDEQDCFR